MTALIETMRARGGRLPLLWFHRTRLERSCTALGLPAPAFWAEAESRAADVHDGVVRVVWNGVAEWSTREVGTDAIALRTSAVRHAPYPHKTTQRDQFARASRAIGEGEPLLATEDGHVAETPRFALVWWDDDGLGAADPATGALPSVGVARLQRLVEVRCQLRRPVDLTGRAIAVVNAVRGLQPVVSLDGVSCVPDTRWADLAARFWPA